MIPPLRWLFPFPDPSTYGPSHPSLYYIEKEAATDTTGSCTFFYGRKTSEVVCIPVMFLNKSHDFKKLLIVFHGNAEDAGCGTELLGQIGIKLNAHVVVVEYPQYGAYKHAKLSEERVIADAETVYTFCVDDLGYEPEAITVMGRSMGTGPAVALAAKKRLRALVLISPYLSLRKVGLERTFCAYLMRDIFNSEKRLPHVGCPVFILHGRKDEIVPFSHGEAMYQRLRKTVEALLVAPDNMTHNNYRFHEDFLLPLVEFSRAIDQRMGDAHSSATKAPDLRPLKRIPHFKSQP